MLRLLLFAGSTLITLASSQQVPDPVPQPPNVTDDQTTATTATVTWVAPNSAVDINGYNLSLVALQYRNASEGNVTECLLFLEVAGQYFVPLDPDVTNHTLTGLLPYVEYEFMVQARTADGYGEFSPAQTFSTDNDNPGVIRDLTTKTLSSSSILVQWSPPACPNGPVTGYYIYYRLSNMPQLANISSEEYCRLQSVNPRMVINDLEPANVYLVHVRAVYNESSIVFLGEVGVEAVHRLNTTVDTSDDVVQLPESITSSSAIVQLPPVSSFGSGDLVYYGVIVVEDPYMFNPSVDDLATLYPNLEPYNERGDLDYYITAAWNSEEAVPSNFTIGNESTTFATRNGTNESYFNARLERATSYCVYVQVQTYSGNDIFTRYSELTCFDTRRGYSLIGLIVGVSVSLLILLLLLLCCNCLCYYWCCRRGQDNLKYHLYYPEQLDDLPNKNELAGTIRLSQHYHAKGRTAVDYPEYVRKMHSNQDYMFTEEFAHIEPSHHPSARASAASKIKNRYHNVVAYDHSRVCLEVLDGAPDSDYINANYIDGYRHPKAFIAAQGPMVDTVEDFWRMIWEQNVNIIVMLTKLEEKGRIRCQCYWPDEGGLREYGPIKVHLQSQVNSELYTVRTFNIQREGVSGEKIVKQFHYTAWPEFGVPKDMEAILLFVKLLMKEHQPDVGPMLVHCSAGAGRTGTLIAIYTQMQRLHAEQIADVHGFVQLMRTSRNLMVQTEAEYIFIHDALVFALENGLIEGVTVIDSSKKEQDQENEAGV